MFVRLRISLPMIKLAASIFTRWFIGVQGRESYILGNFAPHKPKIKPDKSRVARALADSSDIYATFVEYRAACGRIGSACADIRLSPKTDVLVNIFIECVGCV